MPSLNPDWIDALGVLKRYTEVRTIGRIFHETEVAFDVENPVRLWEFRDGTLHMPVKMLSYAKIERVEMLLRAAIERIEGLTIGDRRYLCEKAGCAIILTPDVRERWRVIDWSTPVHLLPFANFEDRPVCKMCKQPVATDSGAWIKSATEEPGPAMAIGAEVDWWKGLNEDTRNRMKAAGTYLTYRTDVHEECMRYAHRVLVPALEEQRRRQAEQATAEVDK